MSDPDHQTGRSADGSSSAMQRAKARAESGTELPPPLPVRRKRKANSPPPLPTGRKRGQPRAAYNSELLALEDLHRYQNLLVFAQAVVEGYYAGKHKSNDFGSNAEFAEHKAYNPGDPVPDIDWRVYARTQNLFVRKYREETDMIVYLVVDVSRSMSFHGRGEETKIKRAARIAAALSYLMLRQGDKVSLTLVNDRVQQHVPGGGTRRHLHELISTLEQFVAAPKGQTKLADGLLECHPLFKKRGRIVILSDFFDDVERLFDGLGPFVHRGFEILMLHVLDPDELELPDVHIARFIDSETGEEVQVEPAEIRRDYQEGMRRFREQLESRGVEHRCRYAPLHTEQPYLDAIESYLGFRENSR